MKIGKLSTQKETLTKEIEKELQNREPFDKTLLNEPPKEENEVSKKSNTSFYIGLLLVTLSVASFVWRYFFANSDKSSSTDTKRPNNTEFRIN